MRYCSRCYDVIYGAVCARCSEEDSIGHRESSSQDPSRAAPEGGERPGADTTGTAVALTGEDAGAGSGAYPGIGGQDYDHARMEHYIQFKDGIVITLGRDVIQNMGGLDVKPLWRLARAEIDRRVLAPGAAMTLTAAEMRQLMQNAGMLGPQMPLATFKASGVTLWPSNTARVHVQSIGGGAGGSGYHPPQSASGGPFGASPNAGAAALNAFIQQQAYLQAANYTNSFVWPAGVGLQAIPAPPVPSKPIEDGGIVVGEIVAWRCWNLTAGCLLRSIAVDSTWTPGQPMSAGDGPHGADWEAKFPHSGGVHAWKKKEDAFKYGASGVGPQGAIIGTVRLSGQVIEHERGYRAEVAEIASLDWLVSDMPLAEHNASLQRARALYGVEGEGGYMKPLDTYSGHPGGLIITDDLEDGAEPPNLIVRMAVSMAIGGLSGGAGIFLLRLIFGV